MKGIVLQRDEEVLHRGVEAEIIREKKTRYCKVIFTNRRVIVTYKELLREKTAIYFYTQLIKVYKTGVFRRRLTLMFKEANKNIIIKILSDEKEIERKLKKVIKVIVT